jgi:hypothetical protein
VQGLESCCQLLLRVLHAVVACMLSAGWWSGVGLMCSQAVRRYACSVFVHHGTGLLLRSLSRADAVRQWL